MTRRLWFIWVLTSLLFCYGLSAHLLPVVSAGLLIQQDDSVQHIVQAGETLYRIAQQYDTTVELIVAANGIADPSRIEIGQELIIPRSGASGSSVEGNASAEEGQILSTYVAVPGDTLAAVARRYNTSPTDIARLNGVVYPTRLPAGIRLRVPGQYSGRLHRVADGETAPGLALRYDVPLWDFLTLNALSSSGALIPGLQVLAPGAIVTGTLPAPFVALDVGPEPVLQGHTVRVKAELESGAQIKGVVADEVLRFAVEDDSHYALFGMHALADPGVYTIALLATDASGDEVYVSQSFEVLDGGYGYEEIVLPVDRDSLLDPEALAAERARIGEIKTLVNPERFWDGPFLLPLDTELTSLFGTRRLYTSPSYQSYGYHEGTDFDGEVGTPVSAPAPGVVVLAEELFVRGGAVVIDHGWGVYSGYWHLSQIDVTVGQHVEPGEQIALVGHTGLSTGAHLHWDFWVNGTNVSALQWTEHSFP